MAQADLGTLIGSQTSGGELANRLRSWRDALHSLHSGSSRPSYAQPGMLWVNNTGNHPVINVWTGTADVPILSYSAGSLLFNDVELRRSLTPLLPTQGEAEAGGLSYAHAWSPLRDAQAIAALAPKGTSLNGSFGGTNVAADTAIAFGDFTASGPAVFGIGNVSLEGATTTIVRARVELYRNVDVSRFYVGPEIVTRHVAGAIERIPVPFVFTGLARNTSYRARIFISSDAQITTTSQIQGLCA